MPDPTLRPDPGDSAALQPSLLRGKTVLITGAGSGLGAALATLLARDGARLVLADLDGERASQVAASLPPDAPAARVLALDVGDAHAAAAAVERIAAHGDRLDVLINNAGTDVTAPIAELTVEQWQRVIDTNLHGPFYLCKAAAAHMQRAGGGHIVNVASTAAKRAWPNACAYHASMWGLLGLSHALHAELRTHGIKVSAVVAGGMRTPFLLERFPELDPAVLQEPAQVAHAIRSLLLLPGDSVVAEITVLPLKESSWP